MTTVYSRPSLSGIMLESPDYRVLGVGLTDRIFLIGHNDGLELNTPYQAADVQETINALGGDTDSPLLKAFMEVIAAGAKDIWLVASAPMSEYEEDIALRNVEYETEDATPTTYTFYSRYYDRLQTSYDLLLEWEAPQIIVPVEAVYYDSGDIDFLTQLSTHCIDGFNITGSVRFGILGTRMETVNDDTVATMLEDERPLNAGDSGKFVIIVVGEGSFTFQHFPNAYSTPLAAVAAAGISQLSLNRGATYLPLRNVRVLKGGDLSSESIDNMAEARLNPAIRTTLGVRGRPYSVVMATDNTVGSTGTDYWTLVHIRLVAQVIEKIRLLGNRFIGTIEYGNFKMDVNNYFRGLVSSRYIKDFTLDINRDINDLNKVLVDVSLEPYSGLRQIALTVVVGPEV